MKELHQSGIGLVKRQAEPITPRKENQLWESNQLGEQSADSLLNTVFFIIANYSDSEAWMNIVIFSVVKFFWVRMKMAHSSRLTGGRQSP
jgi:hypothetical protein